MIYALGLTLVSCLIFGLIHLPNKTISNNMLTNPVYRIVVSTSIILQLCIWCICLNSKQNINPSTVTWGYFIMMIMLTNWIGLTSMLQGLQHILFVGIFMLCFLTLMVIFCHLTWQQEAYAVIQGGMLLLSVCVFGGIILFNNNEFYLLEHVSFIIYSVIFTLFFTVHPYTEWDALPDNFQFWLHDVEGS